MSASGRFRRITVFCGSRTGNRPIYRDLATRLGHALAARSIGLVYGGGNVGLMGVVADAVLERGGEAIGVIPHGLERLELAHRGVRDMRVVDSMHERKQLMASLSQATIALPGSMGTMDELFESLTWSQLGIDVRPIGLLNVEGYYDAFLALLDRFQRDGFLEPRNLFALVVRDEPEALLDALETHVLDERPKWLTKDQG
jgi:uncharacterized protein (TIGR00730 family)